MKRILKTVALLTTGILINGSVLAHEGHENAPLAAHLVFKQNTLHMHATFQDMPMINQEEVLFLEAKDPKTHQTTELNDKIEVVLWMPSMGHGSAPTQVERVVDAQGTVIPGTFKVKNIYFIMGGDWEVQVTLTDADGNQETNSFAVKIAGGHGTHP
jgi:hypothetical protein